MSHVIAALSTGNALSAIGILRLTGEGCAQVAGQVFTLNNGKSLAEAENRKLVLGSLKDAQGRIIDQCMAVYCRGPHSYTGEDTVEFHCHGSPAVLSAGLEALYLAGAKPAQRGEFTKRAFLNGKLALTQAEAVIDLIEAETADAAANAAGQVGGVLQRKLAPVYDTLRDLCSHFHAVLDYPDEDIEDFGLANYDAQLRSAAGELKAILDTFHQGKIMKQGVAAAIVGRPNVGKSSLLNALAGYDRVIVTDIPGTTRDTVEETVLLGSVKLRLMDTAGIRETADAIEAMGVERSKKAIEHADLILFLCDGSACLTPEDRVIMELCKEYDHKLIALVNKSDLAGELDPRELPFSTVMHISAKEGHGIPALAEYIGDLFQGQTPCDGSVLTNTRQQDAIRRASEAMGRAIAAMEEGLTPDAALTDVEEAMEAMGEVTGATVREDITARIFERFCVGK